MTEGLVSGTEVKKITNSGFRTVIITTFTTVFLAELGDKTQLATLLLSAQSGQPALVFIGASLALISCSLIGVLLGRWLTTILQPATIEKTAGLLMISLGIWIGVQASISLLHI
ncbi:hypothetical protein PMYN1_Chma776 (chromatophore) [Paulinella micropora]|uniref:GDT1 family protein n=1 Tax=Paulinella micropora TaxID=1928728 RepID=A0A1L5YD49_9EUKA|nr:hypothetical protein PMNZ_841 [Paulinella micropora]APP88594.1 hypothetical protein PCKR_834 [Paulinella micropora]AQX45361.1 hypothetical protein PFK_834 [Paulinella micropora]AXY63756.1 hypothetical protein PMNZ_841 [Paulinella micropora]BBL86581.1 hypothetical protein PMYN1_Chma776 [Paulinella micropora]